MEVSEEERLVLDLLRLDAGPILEEAITERVLAVGVGLRTRRRDAQDERIFSRARPEVNGVPQSVVGLDVEFVEDHHRGIRSFGAGPVGRQDAEDRPRLWILDNVAHNPKFLR